jgi:hypothetical protein
MQLTTHSHREVEELQSPSVTASKIIVFIHYVSEQHFYRKTKSILKVPATLYEGSLKKLLDDDTLLERLPNLARGRGVNFSNVMAVSFRLGKHGDAVTIDF